MIQRNWLLLSSSHKAHLTSAMTTGKRVLAVIPIQAKTLTFENKRSHFVGICAILQSSVNSNMNANMVKFRKNVRKVSRSSGFNVVAKSCQFWVERRATVCQWFTSFQIFKPTGAFMRSIWITTWNKFHKPLNNLRLATFCLFALE